VLLEHITRLACATEICLSPVRLDRTDACTGPGTRRAALSVNLQKIPDLLVYVFTNSQLQKVNGIPRHGVYSGMEIAQSLFIEARFLAKRKYHRPEKNFIRIGIADS
jgi:hypothetical protein